MHNVHDLDNMTDVDDKVGMDDIDNMDDASKLWERVCFNWAANCGLFNADSDDTILSKLPAKHCLTLLAEDSLVMHAQG